MRLSRLEQDRACDPGARDDNRMQMNSDKSLWCAKGEAAEEFAAMEQGGGRRHEEQAVVGQDRLWRKTAGLR